MARSHYFVGLIGAIASLVVILQLVSSYGLPEFSSIQWKAAEEQRTPYMKVQEQLSAGGVHEEALRQLAGDQYLIGVGKGDITGPVVELNLMGYANASQIGSGLRQRLYSRAFIIGNPNNAAERIVYLVLDTQSGDTAIRRGILEGVKALGPDYAVYTRQNIAVTGTHSHAGPAAWLNYLLPQVTALGFDKQSYQAIVDGTVLSIKRAHESLTPGRLSTGTTEVAGANINRSLWAYLANPEEERNRYTDNVDKTMTLLKFTRDSDGKDVGVLTWFAVHGTSLLGNNTIVAADNKGVAAYLFEQQAKTLSNAAPGFIAGFSQANVGDTTPNTNGAWCEDGTGVECNLIDSTCPSNNKSQSCHGRGPYWGLNDAGTASCFEIGSRQSEGARTIYSSTLTPISGNTIRSYHTYNDMSTYSFTLTNGTTVKTCAAALGYSFAAGTSDGPGAFDFTQGDSGEPSANPIWRVASALIKAPGPEQKACQGEKPILLDVGEQHTPYDWSPNIVDIQMLRVGQFFMIISPGEATTMSGRRWRDAITDASKELVLSGTEPLVVLGGPANSYTHYIATEEEYNIQRYEGASTLYGPHTLAAYINLTTFYLPYLSDTPPSSLPLGPDPQDNRNNSLSFITGVVYDGSPIGKSFGQVLTQPTNATGTRNVVAKFQGANPRNNLHQEDTYAAVEQLGTDGQTWTKVKDDADWELLFEWKRTNSVLGHSEVTITWETGPSTPAGTYRIRYNGDSKAPITASIKGFSGVTNAFTISQ